MQVAVNPPLQASKHVSPPVAVSSLLKEIAHIQQNQLAPMQIKLAAAENKLAAQASRWAKKEDHLMVRMCTRTCPTNGG